MRLAPYIFIIAVRLSKVVPVEFMRKTPGLFGYNTDLLESAR